MEKYSSIGIVSDGQKVNPKSRGDRKKLLQSMNDNQVTLQAEQSRKELFRLTWPIFCETALFSLIGSMDVVMLSRYSDNAVGAVGVVNQVLFFFRVITNIVTAGTGILCAQYIGAGKSMEQKQPLILGALMVNTVIGLLFSLGILMGADGILELMNVSRELYIHGSQYLCIVGGTLFVQTISMTFTALIRSHGRTKATMRFSLVMNLTNLAANYILIYGKLGFPSMGAAGAAIATVLSKILCCLLAGIYLFGRVLPGMSFVPDWKEIRQCVRQILAYGSPAAGEQISYTLSNLVVMAMVTGLGTVSVNAYSYINTIMRYVYLFSSALGQGTAILIGWEVGRQRIDHARRLCLHSVRYSFWISMIAISILSLFRTDVMGLFTQNPQIIALGASVILSDFLLETGRSRNLILVNALRAAGDVHFPLYIGLFSMWFFSVGFSWLLGIKMGLGLVGVWIAIGLGECFRAVGMQIRWTKGAWMRPIQ